MDMDESWKRVAVFTDYYLEYCTQNPKARCLGTVSPWTWNRKAQRMERYVKPDTVGVVVVYTPNIYPDQPIPGVEVFKEFAIIYDLPRVISDRLHTKDIKTHSAYYGAYSIRNTPTALGMADAVLIQTGYIVPEAHALYNALQFLPFWKDDELFRTKAETLLIPNATTSDLSYEKTYEKEASWFTHGISRQSGWDYLDSSPAGEV